MDDDHHNPQERWACIFRRLISMFLWFLIFLSALMSLETMARIWGGDKQVSYTTLYDELHHLKNDFYSGMRNLSRKFEEMRPRIQQQMRSELTGKFHCQVTDISRKMVEKEMKIYDADKTERVDFALETIGGSIVSTPDTQSLSLGSAPGLTCHSADNVIRAHVNPGECWAFKGSSGTVIIQLVDRIYITALAIEHIPPSLSPTGQINSAPKDFLVWGLSQIGDEQGKFLGKFRYENCGKCIQTFELSDDSGQAFKLFKVKIISNHGNPKYTCVYRIRIHGKLQNIYNKEECLDSPKKEEVDD